MRSGTDRPQVGVGCLVLRGDELLLVRRRGAHGGGTWSAPGGHLDYAETPEDCAVRETREETGVRVRDPRFVGITNDLFEDAGKHYVTLWIAADYASGTPVVGDSDELDRVGWFSPRALPHPLFLSLRNLLDGRCTPRDPDLLPAVLRPARLA